MLKWANQRRSCHFNVFLVGIKNRLLNAFPLLQVHRSHISQSEAEHDVYPLKAYGCWSSLMYGSAAREFLPTYQHNNVASYRDQCSNYRSMSQSSWDSFKNVWSLNLSTNKVLEFSWVWFRKLEWGTFYNLHVRKCLYVTFFRFSLDPPFCFLLNSLYLKNGLTK